MAATLASNHYLYNADAAAPPTLLRRRAAAELKANQNSDQPKFPKLVRSVSQLSDDSIGSIEPENDYALKRVLKEHVGSGHMEDALQVFDKMIQSDTYYWNVMIRGFTDCGLFQEAIDLYCRMQREGVRADNYTYPFVIKACGGLFALDQGRKIHGKLFKVGLDSDVYVGNALCAAYAKMGCVCEN